MCIIPTMPLQNESALEVDDGLILPEVGSWASEKHRKIGYYASIFSASMQARWDCRLFIELFSGAGKAKLKDTGKVVLGSPLVALGIQPAFDKYIFCELGNEESAALRKRIENHYPHLDTKVLQADANLNIDEVLNQLPRFGPSYKGLTLCFVDPFNAGNLHFSTIRKLAAALYIDFIVLIPSYMDIKRNCHNYTKPNCSILDNFLGTDSWRNEWKSQTSPYSDFGIFIADKFGKQMATLDYHYESPEDYEIVRMSQDRSLFLYHLGFFSRNKLGVKFWRETRDRTNRQLSLL